MQVDLLYDSNFTSMTNNVYKFNGCTTSALATNLSANGYTASLFLLYVANYSSTNQIDAGSVCIMASSIIEATNWSIQTEVGSKTFVIYGSTGSNYMAGVSLTPSAHRMKIYGIKI